MTRNIFRKSTLNVAVAMTLGLSALPQAASADIITMNYSGYFHIVDPTGAPLANGSIWGNQYETPINGTISLDTVSGAGTASLPTFDWMANPFPATFQNMQLQTIGGNLILANGLWSWGNNNDIPVSMVWDASGLFASMPAIYANGYGSNGTVVSGVGVRSPLDGTWIGNQPTHTTSGYMDLGIVPIATTKWNVTPLCNPVDQFTCLGVNPSGALPLVADNAANPNDWNAIFMGGDGLTTDPGAVGSRMLAGPFMGYSMSIDFASLTVTSIVTPVPAPAAVWLLTSGLAGLVGVAGRRRCSSIRACFKVR